MARTSKARLAGNVLSALRRKEGARQIPGNGGMTEVLLSVLIARGSSMAAGRRALQSLRESVVNWNELRVTRPWEISGLLGDINDADTKATAIHEVLTSIFENTHDLELSFLEGVTAQEAGDFLAGLGNLTEEMISEVILSGKGHFLVVPDAGIVRAAQRVGLIRRRMAPAKCQEEFEAMLGPEKAYQLTYLLKKLAESTCTPRGYRCAECTLRTVCAVGRKSKQQ